MISPDMKTADIKRAVPERIDYSLVDERLQAERSKSIRYLSDALGVTAPPVK